MSLNVLTPLKENWGCSIPISPVLQAGGDHGLLKVPGSPYPKIASCYRPSSAMGHSKGTAIHNSTTHRDRELCEADEHECDSGIITLSSVETSAFEGHMDTSGGRMSASPTGSPICPPVKKFCRLNLTGSSPTFSQFDSPAMHIEHSSSYKHRRSSIRRSIGTNSQAGHHPIFNMSGAFGAQISNCASTPSPLIQRRLPNYRNPYIKPTDSPAGLTPNASDEARPARLSEINNRRYEDEFIELHDLDAGRFGVTYIARNRFDGRTYCIKKLPVPFACGSGLQKRLLNEVFALSVIDHANLVRYFSTWVESSSLFIQLEFCTGGSLQKVIDTGRLLSSESDLLRLLLHTCRGLRHLHHSRRLAHMDIKPANILMQIHSDSSVVYKLGDFGHATSIDNEDAEFDEGDSRFMALEILERPFGSNGDVPIRVDLCRADIFSLGLTALVASTGLDLPNNGTEWKALRKVGLPPLTISSIQCYNLLRSMTDPLPRSRPTAITLCSALNEMTSECALRSPVFSSVFTSNSAPAMYNETDDEDSMDDGEFDFSRRRKSRISFKPSEPKPDFLGSRVISKAARRVPQASSSSTNNSSGASSGSGTRFRRTASWLA